MSSSKNNDENKEGKFPKRIDLKNLEKYENIFTGVFREVIKDKEDIEEVIAGILIADIVFMTTCNTNDGMVIDGFEDAIVEAYLEAIEMIETEERFEKLINACEGKEPLLLTVGHDLLNDFDDSDTEEDTYELNEEVLNSSFDDLIKEMPIAKELYDYIWSKKENRLIEIDEWSLKLSKTIPKYELVDYELSLKDLLLRFFENDGEEHLFTLKVFKNEKEYISCMKKQGKVILSFEKDYLKWMYSHNFETGEKMEIPENWVFDKIKLNSLYPYKKITKKVLSQYDNEYIGMFKEMADESDLDSMIYAVSYIDLQLVKLATKKDVEAEKIKVIEAWECIRILMLNSEERHDYIYNYFGEEWPLLFTMGAIFEKERDVQQLEDEFDALPAEYYEQAKDIVEYVWNRKGIRHLVLDNIETKVGLDLYPKMDEEDEMDYYYSLKKMILEFYKSEIAVLVLEIEQKGEEKGIISGITKEDNKITALDVEYLRWSYTHDAETGEEILPQDAKDYEVFPLKKPLTFENNGFTMTISVKK